MSRIHEELLQIIEKILIEKCTRNMNMLFTKEDIQHMRSVYFISKQGSNKFVIQPLEALKLKWLPMPAADNHLM